MIVQVLSIKPSYKLNVFDVKLLVGIDIYTFEIEVQEIPLNEHNLQVAGDSRYLSETLQYNAGAIGKVCKLVLKVYNGQEVEFPALITEHLAINQELVKREAVFA